DRAVVDVDLVQHLDHAHRESAARHVRRPFHEQQDGVRLDQLFYFRLQLWVGHGGHCREARCRAQAWAMISPASPMKPVAMITTSPMKAWTSACCRESIRPVSRLSISVTR